MLDRYGAIYEEKKDSPLEYLKQVALSYQEFVLENPDMRKFLAFILNNTFDEDFRVELEGFMKLNIDATERMLARAVEQGEISHDINPRSTAWLFVGGYFTLILMAEIGDEELLGTGYLESVFRLLLGDEAVE